MQTYNNENVAKRKSFMMTINNEPGGVSFENLKFFKSCTNNSKKCADQINKREKKNDTPITCLHREAKRGGGTSLNYPRRIYKSMV